MIYRSWTFQKYFLVSLVHCLHASSVRILAELRLDNYGTPLEINYFLCIKLWYENNTFSAFIKSSFQKIILSSDVQSFFQINVVVSAIKLFIFIKHHFTKTVPFWRKVLCSILKLNDEKRYYILTRYFYNEKRVLC